MAEDLRTRLLHELQSNKASYVGLPEYAEKVLAALVWVVASCEDDDDRILLEAIESFLGLRFLR